MRAAEIGHCAQRPAQPLHAALGIACVREPLSGNKISYSHPHIFGYPAEPIGTVAERWEDHDRFIKTNPPVWADCAELVHGVFSPTFKSQMFFRTTDPDKSLRAPERAGGCAVFLVRLPRRSFPGERFPPPPRPVSTSTALALPH